MLTVEDYLGQHSDGYESEITEAIRSNAAITVERANALMMAFGESRGLRSGWRPAEVNASIPNAAPMSKHMTGQAVDVADPEGDLDQWCFDHQDMLESLELWLEHPASTKGWCHVQIVPPRSGNRVFYP